MTSSVSQINYVLFLYKGLSIPINDVVCEIISIQYKHKKNQCYCVSEKFSKWIKHLVEISASSHDNEEPIFCFSQTDVFYSSFSFQTENIVEFDLNCVDFSIGITECRLDFMNHETDL